MPLPPVDEPTEPTEPARFRLHTPTVSVLTDGCRMTSVGFGHGRELADRAAALAATSSSGAVVGALPFAGGSADLASPSRLDVVRGGPVTSRRAPETVGLEPDGLRDRPERAGYCAAVEEALCRIRRGEFDKVVLGRFLEARLTGPVSVDALVARLSERHPDARTFATPLADGSSLVGASPELLVARHGRVVRSHPLAGSAPRSCDPAQDEAAGEALLASDKDRREHAFVVEMIADTLAPFCRDLHVPPEPALVSTRHLWHLGTWMEGTLRDDDVPAIHLAAELQPTPALAGTPRPEAVRAVGELESVPRGFAGGCVGWSDAQGDGEWTVAIRCARVHGSRAELFAGAGIVAESEAQAELAETDAKLATFLEAFTADVEHGIEQETEVVPARA